MAVGKRRVRAGFDQRDQLKRLMFRGLEMEGRWQGWNSAVDPWYRSGKFTQQYAVELAQREGSDTKYETRRPKHQPEMDVCRFVVTTGRIRVVVTSSVRSIAGICQKHVCALSEDAIGVSKLERVCSVHEGEC